eukprot:gene37676-45770_t
MAEDDEFDPKLIPNLQKEAIALADLTYERAFAIDESNIAQSVEDYAFTSLIDKFYKKVYASDDAELRSMFSEDFELNVQNLSDYLYQRCGGNSFYSDRKGFPNLGMRHQHLNLTERVVEKWLDLMEQSLDESEADFAPDHRTQLLDFMRFTAFFIYVFNTKYKSLMRKGPLF